MKTKEIDTRIKPGREIRDGVLCFDGSGGSGYTGPCSRPKLQRSLLRDQSPLMAKLAAAAAKKAERAAKRKAKAKK